MTWGRPDPLGRPPWGGRRAQRLRAAVLARDTDPALGYAPCHRCGGRADSVDHWPIPRSEGGPDTLDNLRASCLPCNVAAGVVMQRARRAAAQGPPPPSRDWGRVF